MQIVSELVKVPNNNYPSVEYIEAELEKLKIAPLRWAVVHVDDIMYTLSLAYLKE